MLLRKTTSAIGPVTGIEPKKPETKPKKAPSNYLPIRTDTAVPEWKILVSRYFTLGMTRHSSAKTEINFFTATCLFIGINGEILQYLQH
jgi:hypothetical protein